MPFQAMSALPRKADIDAGPLHVGFGPTADRRDMAKGTRRPSSISQCAIAISLDDCSRLTSIRSITTMIAPIRAHPDSNKRPAVKVPVKSFR
jgi:hypothetical protein